MKESEKLEFIDKVVSALSSYLPQAMDDVKYWIACQFALESNFGQSLLARNKHNYCGMCIPKSRISLNSAVSGNFAKYDCFLECVLDYCYWLAWNKFTYLDLFNLDLFTRKLIAKGYCPESDYVDRVYTLYNSFHV